MLEMTPPRTPWRETILLARQRGAFTDAEKMRAASNWTTCAVGEQVANGVVTHVQVFGVWDEAGMRGGDELVRMSGLDFGMAVSRNDFDEAERLLDAIEQRAMAIKRGTA